MIEVVAEDASELYAACWSKSGMRCSAHPPHTSAPLPFIAPQYVGIVPMRS